MASPLRRSLWHARRRVAESVLARRRTPRVGLVGFYGWGNYGDELFELVYREHLGPTCDVRLLHDQLEKPYYSRGADAAVDEVDAVVIGGGDLVVPWNLSQLYWKKEYLRRPVFISGVGVPESREMRPKPWVVAHLRQFFQHPSVQWISARDAESVDWIEKNLAPSAPVRLTSDLVFALSLPEAVRQEDLVGVVTRKRPKRDDDYTQVQALAAAAQAQGMRVRHIVLGTHGTGEADAADSSTLDVPGKELYRSESLDDLSRAIGECRLLASMKFHGSLVAAMYGTPSVVMMPTAKNRRLFARLGRPELVSTFDSESLPSFVDPLPDLVDESAVAPRRAEARATLAELDALLQRVPRAAGRA
jgi:polysaccharide pyruvyl transferase WcaK-like protein